MKSAHITTYICAIVIAYVRMQEHIHLTAFNMSFVTPSLMNSTIVHWNVLFTSKIWAIVWILMHWVECTMQSMLSHFWIFKKILKIHRFYGGFVSKKIITIICHNFFPTFFLQVSPIFWGAALALLSLASHIGKFPWVFIN